MSGAPHATFRSFSGIGEAMRDWESVLGRIGRPRYRHLPGLYEAYSSTLAAADTVGYHVASLDGAPLSVIPLVTGRRPVGGIPLRTLELPHDPHLPAGDFPLADRPVPAALLGDLVLHLRRSSARPFDALFLPALPEDSAAWRSFASDPPPLSVSWESRPCHVIDVEPYDRMERAFSKNFRGSLRKARNRLFRHGPVEVAALRTPGEVAGAFEKFLEVESSGWKGRRGTAIRCNERWAAFYRGIVDTISGVGRCEIHLLESAGRCIAGQLCVKVGRRLSLLKIGYDENFSSFAPGNMLMESVLRRCAEEGEVDTVDLVTCAEWHRNWNPRLERRFSAMTFSGSVRSLPAYLLLRSWKGARRMFPGRRSHEGKAPAP